jgi:hypothetical protein
LEAGPAEEDKEGKTGLGVVVTEERTAVALPVVLTVALLATTADMLEFDATNDDTEKIEEAKDGGPSAVVGSTSSPSPQEIGSPLG